MTDFIRVWKRFDLQEISNQLLIVGDLTGDCAKCKTLGINYGTAKTCPGCGTSFKYISSRSREIAKIITKRPDLVFIDFDDYKRAMAKIKAKDLFFSKE